MSRVDQFYADHIAKQTPLGAYRAPTEVNERTAQLNTLKHYLHQASLVVDSLLSTPAKLYTDKQAADVAWSTKRGDYVVSYAPEFQGDPKECAFPPGFDAQGELLRSDCEACVHQLNHPHPMMAEALRERDEHSPEDQL